MRKETDLEKVKEIAITLLYIEPEQVNSFVVTHPFINSPILNDSNYNIFNIFEEPQKFEKWRTGFAEHLKSRDSIGIIFAMICNPYKLAFFKYVNEFLSEEDYADLLSYCWVNDANIYKNINVTKSEMVRFFKKANRNLLMDEEEREVLENLPENITIYRGVRDKKYKNSMSWTLDKDKAIWFAKRFSAKTPMLYTTTISKNQILCYTNARNEQEIIIDPKILKGCIIQEEHL